jgi:putative transcriptional regulator
MDLRGAAMNILRDLRESTRILFLHEITANHHTRLRTIADRLGMTVQGASGYARLLQADGLLTLADGEYRATKRGIDLLQGRLRELRAFVEQASRTTAFVETTTALAGAAIHRGDRTGLFMENGYLMAYPGRLSSSVGTATEDAAKGEDVAVRGLEGIVALRPGRITIARVPASRPAARRLSPDSARKVLRRSRGAAVATTDIEGLVACRRLRLVPRIEFAPLAGTLAAAERGLDVLLLVPEDRVAEAVQTIEAANARREDKIPYETFALG